MNSDSIVNNPTHPPNVTRTDLAYRVAVRAALVAGVFSAVVAAILLIAFSRRDARDLIDAPQVLKLKTELTQEPQNEELKAAIRDLDLQLRKSYFRQRRFTVVGAWLLLCGVVVFLAAWKWAAILRQELPMPEPLPPRQDTEARTMRAARWSVAALGLALGVAAVLLVRSLPSELPPAVATVMPPSPPGTDGRLAQAPAAAEPADFPTDEEIEANWPRFRGPGGLGISAHKDVPTTWDGASGDGILWKTAVPLEGNNSSIVWGNRVFLSGATAQKREVYCFDADDGKLLWQREVPAGAAAAAGPPKVNEETGYAAPTPATDGRRVYAIFATGDVAAFDFEGRKAWAKSLGVPKSSYGYAASLTTYRNLLLIQFDQGSAKDELSKMIALDAATGETVWQQPRNVTNSWASPIVARMADGSSQLITASDPWVIAYDPADGRELWRSKSLEADVGPSPVAAHGIVFVTSQFPALSAIRADGHGDVTKTHVLWQGEDGLPDTSSPLATDQYVFLLASYGLLTCYDTATGKNLWEEEFDGAAFSSSPTLVGKRLYLFSEEGKVWIVEPATDRCTRIGEADLGEECVTSPAIGDGRIYIRGKQHLFAIGHD